MADNWTPEKVALHFEEAVLTLRRLPAVKKPDYARIWLDILYTPNEQIGQPVFKRKICATPEAIRRLEQTFDWTVWLEVEERKLIWKRAARVPWKKLCWEFGYSRTTAWSKWVTACVKISERLNSQFST